MTDSRDYDSALMCILTYNIQNVNLKAASVWLVAPDEVAKMKLTFLCAIKRFTQKNYSLTDRI